MRKNWELPDNFPNPHVIEAYKKPVVDRSRDRITFGRPDVEMLRRFCSDQFGWARAKADELLNPVAKAFDERETQRRMEEFFGYSQRFAKIQSVRLQRAVRGISKQANPEIELQPDEVATSSASEAQRRKRKAAAPSEGAERRPTGPAAPQPPPEGKRKRRPESKQAAASRGGKRTKQDQQAEEDSEPTNVEGGGTASAPHAAGVRGKGRGGRAKGMAGGGGEGLPLPFCQRAPIRPARGCWCRNPARHMVVALILHSLPPGGHPHPISSGRPRRGDEAAEKPGAAPAVHLPARKEQQQTPLAALSPPGRRGDCGMPADLALGSSEGPAAQTPPRPPVVLPPAPRRSRAATAAGGATQDAPQPSGTTSHAARPLQHEAAAPSRPAVVLPPAPRRRNTRGA